jgi:hypothetical protein
MVGVELSKLRDGFLVSDAGAARREAGLLGGHIFLNDPQLFC